MKEVSIEKNEWHPREDIDEVIECIKKCSVDGDFAWSWSRDFDLKYVSITFDMRDGAFTISGRRGRIDFERLKTGGLKKPEDV